MSFYEHLHVDMSPEALSWIKKTLELTGDYAILSEHARIEVQNFINECRARVQYAAAGEPDISEGAPVPVRDVDVSDLL